MIMMQKISLLLLALSLAACSDNDKLASGSRDAGSTDDQDGGGDAPASSGVERPPESLQRPPGKKLPDDLKPPGYEK